MGKHLSLLLPGLQGSLGGRRMSHLGQTHSFTFINALGDSVDKICKL